MKKGFVIAGLMLATVFASCEKDRIEDDVIPPTVQQDDEDKYVISSIKAVQEGTTSKSSDNGFSVVINDERIDAKFSWEEFCTGNNGCTNSDGTVSVFRVYTIEQSNTLGFDSFNITVKFNPPGANGGDFTFVSAELNFTTSTGLFQVTTTGTNLTIDGEDGFYDGKGLIGTNTFTDQTGEIDLSWTMNVSQGVEDEHEDNEKDPVVVTCDNVNNTLSAGAVGEEFIINEVNCTMVAFDGVIIHRGENFALGTQGFFDIQATAQPVIFKGFSSEEQQQIRSQMNATDYVHFE